MTLGRDAQGVIGIGRVRMPTLAFACRREIEIHEFVPVGYFEVVATARAGSGAFRIRHAPKARILKREDAQAVLEAARAFEGPLGVRTEDRRQRPPRLHDLPSLQKLCSTRFGWPAAKTLHVAQELCGGDGKKIPDISRAPRCAICPRALSLTFRRSSPDCGRAGPTLPFRRRRRRRSARAGTAPSTTRGWRGRATMRSCRT